MQENNLSSISKASNYEQIGEFWDTHDFTEFDTEFDDDTPDIEFNVTCAISTVACSLPQLTSVQH